MRRRPKQPLYIEPSILAADFGALAAEVRRAEAAGADGIHIDIMDGHFVPSLALCPKAVAAINRTTDLFLDVHIMVYNPFDYIEMLAASGADAITFHFEATEDVDDVIDFIHRCGLQAGLAFRPETSQELIPPFLGKCERILIMTVSPGFGGQAFLSKMLPKIRFVRDLAARLPPPKEEEVGLEIQVDGGIDSKTASLCVRAGAHSLVAGTYLFASENMAERISTLRESGKIALKKGR